MEFAREAREWGVDMWDMVHGTDDLQDAYRHIPTRSPHLTVVALAPPGASEVSYFSLPGFNFGLKGAVPGFNRFPEFMTHAALSVLGVVCCHFFDDYSVCEP